MKNIDYKIKQSLQSKLQPIDDNSFTKNIINIHLAKKPIVKYSLFGNFLPLIIGMYFLLISIGLVFALEQGYQWIKVTGINIEEGLLLVLISMIFLLFKIVDEFIIGDMAYKSLAKQ